MPYILPLIETRGETVAGKSSNSASAAALPRRSVDDIVSAVLTASRVLVGVSARSLIGVEDTVTVPQFRALVVLESHGETSLNALAEALDVNASSAMRMVDRLLAAGLVTRRENPNDRRQVLIGLTDDGADVVRRVTARRRREITRIVTAMPDRRRADLVAALRAFAEAAGEAEPDVDDEAQISILGW
jgi:DNA-binding MarR family transcriptional regulator